MAANHTKLIGLGVGAILAISAAPMYAVARHPSADTLKAEARNFVKIISGDKRKSRNYRHLPRRPQIMMSARSTSLSHGLALRLREPSPARAT